MIVNLFQKLMQQIQHLFGKLFGDKGYLSQTLAQELLEQHMVELVTKLRKNMKAKLMDEMDRYFLRKRAIIESIYDQHKNISQIEHTRHRSLTGFMVNLLIHDKPLPLVVVRTRLNRIKKDYDRPP